MQKTAARKYTLRVERETGLVCLLHSVPFVVGLSLANLSHRKPKPSVHFVTATAFRDMTKLTALIGLQWR